MHLQYPNLIADHAIGDSVRPDDYFANSGSLMLRHDPSR